MAIEVRRDADRFVTTRPGSVSRYSFSFGHHYDPRNVSFGPVVAVNDERVAPGAGFEAHPHAGLVIVTYVVWGSLTHEGIASRTVSAGEVAVLRCGNGVTHAERNTGSDELRFVQTWLSTGSPDIGYGVTTGRVQVDGTTAVAGEISPGTFTGHLFVATGTVRVGDDLLGEGDSLRARTPVEVDPAAGATGVLVHLPTSARGG